MVYKMHNRKLLRRFYQRGAVYFITTYTKNRYPFFKEDVFCEVLSYEVDILSRMKEFITHAYVIMPDHLHILIQPEGETNISKIMQSIKKNSSRYINQIIDNNPVREIYKSPLPVSEGIKEDIKAFEKHLSGLIDFFLNKYSEDEILTMPRFQWQRSFHDHILRDNEDTRDYYEYIINNPVKESVVDDSYDYSWIYIRDSDDFGRAPHLCNMGGLKQY